MTPFSLRDLYDFQNTKIEIVEELKRIYLEN